MAADGGATWKQIIILFSVVCISQNGVAAKKDEGYCESVPKMKIDTAYVTILTAGVEVNLTLRGITEECYTCKLQTIAVIKPNVSSCTVLVDTRWRMRLAISTDDKYSQLNKCGETALSHRFVEKGNYTIFVKDDGSKKISCDKPLLYNNPADSNIPIYVAMGSFVAAALLWMAAKRFTKTTFMYRIIYRLSPRSGSFLDPDKKDGKERLLAEEHPSGKQKNLRRRKRPMSPDKSDKTAYTAQDLGMPSTVAPGESAGRPQTQKERLKSLDTFRGISIVIMIFVNYRGGDYWFFRHSKWNGINVADLVFPWFVWIMGTAMAYSFQSLIRKATPKSHIMWKIFKRSCILFALGLLINSSDGLNPVRMREFRIPGVLQRFAGTYLIIATMHLVFVKQTTPTQITWWTCIQDVVIYWQEWLFNLVLVLVWLMLTFFLSVPGCPKGYLGPGGLANDDPNHHNVTNCTGGAASYIDRKIFGEGRIYQHPTCKEIYRSIVPHDPEGLLGTLTSCFMCFLGLQAGKILLTFHDWKARVKRFVIWGIILGIIAVILCEGKKDGGFIPINKNLWSLSFVICLSSFAFFLFAFCYVTIDVYKVWSGAPFYYPGMNSIFLYVCHLVFLPYFPVSVHVDGTSHWARLAMNLWGPVLWCLVTYKMHLDKRYITI